MSEQHIAAREEWRPIQANDNYEISNLGNVRRRAASRTAPVGMLIRSRTATNGYTIVNLWHRNKNSTALVHRLVAFAFIGSPADGETDVSHIDDDRSNNCVRNLCWSTHQANMREQFDKGRTCRGEGKCNAILTAGQVVLIRSEFTGARGDLRRLARKHGLKAPHVRKVVNRLIWAHVP